MFELPEFVTLAEQMNEKLRGKVVRSGQLGNRPHKFVWYNRDPMEFERMTKGLTVGQARARGKWLSLPLEPGYVLLMGECGGKILYHHPGNTPPKKYHLYLTFEDGSFLTATTQMWGAYELYEQGQEAEREYVKGMRTTPVDPEFTSEYFNELIDEHASEKKRSAKSLLTQDQLIPGLGNAIAQDILFRARLHPRRPIGELSSEHRQALYHAIVDTVREVIEKGGRYDEYDLYNQPGGYIRIMDKNAVGRPCPECGGEVEKIQYLGGACYVCPNCQQ
ncbi:MAG: DNA-formamidopyrimidine glycosylase family protein [Anaerolineales bacterium]|jgi:formamidopyrimidine-DNA glycosylase